MTSPPPESLAGLSLAEIVTFAAKGRIAPVESWNPSFCGDSAMRIMSDGTWLHEGTPITRPSMVRLFSSVLRRETDGRHVLVTPAEKLEIAVDDAPFLVTDMISEGAGAERHLAFRTNVGDLVVAGAGNPLTLEDRGQGARLYLHVRGQLDAMVNRAVYYDLANLAIEEASASGSPIGLWSEGVFFPMTA
ncbi:MAG: DUF1285 domain-containing protein [Sphingomonadales bacterium]|nr:DUF1285 domain-containing protein [Sphingomonadales bacterium]MDE2171126.1 DUF1285 domain-containing protein [Sphingomonadales bacterium]